MEEILKNAEFATVIGGIMILFGILIILICIIGAVMREESEPIAGLVLLATFGALVIMSGLYNITTAKAMVTTEDKRIEETSTYKYYIDNKEINVEDYDLSEYTVEVNEDTHKINLIKKK